MNPKNDLRHPVSFHFSRALEDLVQAYTLEKPGVFLVSCDNNKVTFSRFRPHNVISYGVSYKDSGTGSIRTISQMTQNSIPFTMLFRVKAEKQAAFVVFEDGLELSSDGPTDFVAYFCVKMKELESIALYTISKSGYEISCTENYSTKNVPPAKFCQTVFAFLGGTNNEQQV